MRKLLLVLSVLLQVCGQMQAQVVMSDAQVKNYIRREVKAGTSQSQIVTNLMQRGVKMEQIRRMRDEYMRERNDRQMSGSSQDVGRMRSNAATDDSKQEVVSARRGARGEVYQDASTEYDEAELAVQSESNVTAGRGCCRLSRI